MSSNSIDVELNERLFHLYQHAALETITAFTESLKFLVKIRDLYITTIEGIQLQSHNESATLELLESVLRGNTNNNQRHINLSEVFESSVAKLQQGMRSAFSRAKETIRQRSNSIEELDVNQIEEENELLSNEQLFGENTANKDLLERVLPIIDEQSPRYMVICSAGAIVRSGVELTNPTVIKYNPGEIVMTYGQATTSAGILRLRTARGWISRYLTTGEDVVVPGVRGRIVWHEGAVVRQGIELTSNQIRVLAEGQQIFVYERRLNMMGVTRLRTEFGWISHRLTTGELVIEVDIDKVHSQAEANTIDYGMHPTISSGVAVSHYMIVHSAGAVVRRGIELSSPTLRVIPPGTVVNVFNERRNSQGILRLRTSWGWISRTLTTGEQVCVPSTVGDVVRSPSSSSSSRNQEVSVSATTDIIEEHPESSTALSNDSAPIVVAEEIQGEVQYQIIPSDGVATTNTSPYVNATYIVELPNESAMDLHSSEENHNNYVSGNNNDSNHEDVESIVDVISLSSDNERYEGDYAEYEDNLRSRDPRGAIVASAVMADTIADGEDLASDSQWMEFLHQLLDTSYPSAVGTRYMIIHPDGAIVQSGIELDTEQVYLFPMGRVVMTFGQATTSAGILRLRTARGWISRYLTTGEDVVVPGVRGRIVWHEGAVVRQGIELTSGEIRRIPAGQEVYVYERRLNSTGVPRLRTEFGWISFILTTGEQVIEVDIDRVCEDRRQTNPTDIITS